MGHPVLVLHPDRPHLRVWAGPAKIPGIEPMTVVFFIQSVLVRFASAAAVALFFACCAALAAAPTVPAQLDRDTVALGETVTLSLTFTDAAPGNAPQLPALPGLRYEGVRQSSEFNIVNGVPSQRVTLHYTLSPTQEGAFTIPAMQLNVGGKTLATRPLALRVVKGAAGAGANTNLAFVRLIVPRTNVFIGETFTIQVQLFFQELAEQLQMPQVRAQGFTLVPTPQGAQRQSSARVGNANYNVLILEMAATAARAGDLPIGPVEWPIVVAVPDPRGRSRDPFAIFGFGPPKHALRLNLSSEPVVLHVEPLPAQGVPESFSGAIGSFQMKVVASPTNLAVGDPITVQVDITGRGALDSVKLPEQAAWREFKVYSSKPKTSPTDTFGLAGSKTFELAVAPENHEIRSLPPVLFSFFDPDARAYRTLTGPAIPLSVRPGSVGSAPPPSLTNAAPAGERPPADDLVHIKPRLEPATRAGRLLVREPWFIAVVLVAPGAWLALLMARKRREALASNPRLVRQRQVARKIRDGLQELRAHAATRQSEPFFATLFRLLQEQIGERLDLPASSITEAIIDEKLVHRGASAETRAVLHELFQTCNQARYAPMQSSREMSELIPRLEMALAELRKIEVR